jgi:dTDP-glucose pyrophosphorylase
MKIIIPMAGAGQRFIDGGYKVQKAVLPVVYRKTGESMPMVVASVKDLPSIATDGENIAFIIRNFHIDMGVDGEIKDIFPRSTILSVDKLTEGQACTCLLAEDFIDSNDELLIAACDNGIEFDQSRFEEEKKHCDTLVFTYRHNPKVCDNPDAYGWVIVNDDDTVVDVSVKKHISDNPENDHAIVATFWFKRGNIFVDSAKKMIEEDDRINNEFYVDKVVSHVLEMGYKVKVFEVNRFINYGNPEDYENYHKTVNMFKEFLKGETIWQN